jgi:hypothetical protein
LAWLAYADENDDKIVCGMPFGYIKSNDLMLESWVGRAFAFPESRSDVIENTDKGALWPWIKDIDIYRCSRGRPGHVVTYSIVAAANGCSVEGTDWQGGGNGSSLLKPGNRVGSTVLRFTRLTDIYNPGAGQRAVFIDKGQTPDGPGFYVNYLYPQWYTYSPPPIQHCDGTTLSMADGHVEYWKWKGNETVNIPLELYSIGSIFLERLEGKEDYEPQTEDGIYDLQRLQKATWGRIGYSAEQEP